MNQLAEYSTYACPVCTKMLAISTRRNNEAAAISEAASWWLARAARRRQGHCRDLRRLKLETRLPGPVVEARLLIARGNGRRAAILLRGSCCCYCCAACCRVALRPRGSRTALRLRFRLRLLLDPRGKALRNDRRRRKVTAVAPTLPVGHAAAQAR